MIKILIFIQDNIETENRVFKTFFPVFIKIMKATVLMFCSLIQNVLTVNDTTSSELLS